MIFEWKIQRSLKEIKSEDDKYNVSQNSTNIFWNWILWSKLSQKWVLQKNEKVISFGVINDWFWTNGEERLIGCIIHERGESSVSV